MQELARGQWGFDGYITGDCGAVQDALGSYPHSHDFGVKGSSSWRDAHGFNISSGRGPNTQVPWNNMSLPVNPLSSYQAAGMTQSDSIDRFIHRDPCSFP